MFETTALIGVSVFAGALASITGFGVGSLLTPVFLWWLAPHEAVAAVGIPHVVATGARCMNLRREVDFKLLYNFGLASAIGGLAGAVVQGRFGSRILTAVLGVLLILSGFSELRRRAFPIPDATSWRMVGGLLSGFFGGLVGNQGGIRSAALLGFRLDPKKFVATATAVALIVDSVRLPFYLMNYHHALRGVALQVALSTVGVFIGTFWGVKILKQIPEQSFRQIVGVLLIVLGISLAMGVM